MAVANTKDGYGAFTKFFHWAVVIVFALQYVGANIMTRVARGETALGLTQGVVVALFMRGVGKSWWLGGELSDGKSAV